MMLRVWIPVAQVLQAGLHKLQWVAFLAGRQASRGAHALDGWILARLRDAGGLSSQTSRPPASERSYDATNLARRDRKLARRVFSHRMPGDRE